MSDFDLVVLGAGPAGMSAASKAAQLGLSVCVLDEQNGLGGQIYRSITQTTDKRISILGTEYLSGDKLVMDIIKNSIEHISKATVWDVNQTGLVSYSVNGTSHAVKGKKVIIATGAIERATPIPGWTLPNVMTAGAAQILLKQSGLVPKNAIIAGSGPLIYLIAVQMINAGQPPIAIVETQNFRDMFNAIPALPTALLALRYLAKGNAMLSQIRRAKIPRYTGATDLDINGQDEVETLSFKQGGKQHKLYCKTLLLHQGVVPNIQISQSLNIEHKWDAQQHCFEPVKNEWGLTKLDNIYITGDGASIAGAKAAEYSGILAALHCAYAIGNLNAEQLKKLALTPKRALRKELYVRPFLNKLYPVAHQVLEPKDGTIICRCEEVTAGDIRSYAKNGCDGPNQTKAFGRCGMGPCQGRYCGLTVTEILANSLNKLQNEVGYYKIRSPLKPITLNELARINRDEIENKTNNLYE